jgi:hypothetical protein
MLIFVAPLTQPRDLKGFIIVVMVSFWFFVATW